LEVYSKYLEEFRTAQADAQAKVFAAQSTYAKELSGLGSDAQKARELYGKLQQQWLELNQSLGSRLEEALKTPGGVQGFQEKIGIRFAEIYEQYLRDIRDCWAKIDIRSVSPTLLHNVSANSSAVAHTVFCLRTLLGPKSEGSRKE
jgi:hypothetical protein